jgi:hypothetical protein
MVIVLLGYLNQVDNFGWTFNLDGVTRNDRNFGEKTA